MAENDPVYFDYNATAPLRPKALALMYDVLAETGNASSIHRFGRTARSHVEKAREQIATLTGTNATQITFTSGATESNNALMKVFHGERVLVSAIEHPSILEAAPDAERIPVTKDGIIDMTALETMLDNNDPPALISVMAVNNETGAIQPVEEVARLAKKKHPGIFVHCDAAQAAGRVTLDFPAWQLDYMSLSAHKMGGPQGVGALITAPGARPAKLLYGGGQEKRQRAGTENVAGIAGFGAAAATAQEQLPVFQALSKQRDGMEESLKKIAPDLVIAAANAPRVSNTSLLCLPDIPAQTQIMALDLDGIAVSSGAACSSGSVRTSYVLKEMGLDDNLIKGALRVSFGWHTTQNEINRFVASWKKLYQSMKDKT